MKEREPRETPDAFEALLESTLHERSSTQPVAGLERRLLQQTSAETRVPAISQGSSQWLPWSYAAAALLAVLVASGLGLRSWKGAHVSRAVHPGATQSLHSGGSNPSDGLTKRMGAESPGGPILPAQTVRPKPVREIGAHPGVSSSAEQTGVPFSTKAELSAEESLPRLDTFPSAPHSSGPDVPSGQVRRTPLHSIVVLGADVSLDMGNVIINPVTIAEVPPIQELP